MLRRVPEDILLVDGVVDGAGIAGEDEMLRSELLPLVRVGFPVGDQIELQTLRIQPLVPDAQVSIVVRVQSAGNVIIPTLLLFLALPTL